MTCDGPGAVSYDTSSSMGRESCRWYNPLPTPRSRAQCVPAHWNLFVCGEQCGRINCEAWAIGLQVSMPVMMSASMEGWSVIQDPTRAKSVCGIRGNARKRIQDIRAGFCWGRFEQRLPTPRPTFYFRTFRGLAFGAWGQRSLRDNLPSKMSGYFIGGIPSARGSALSPTPPTGYFNLRRGRRC